MAQGIGRSRGGRTTKIHAVVDGLEIPGSKPRLFADKPLTADGSIRLNDSAHPMDVTASHALLSLRGHAVMENRTGLCVLF